MELVFGGLARLIPVVGRAVASENLLASSHAIPTLPDEGAGRYLLPHSGNQIFRVRALISEVTPVPCRYRVVELKEPDYRIRDMLLGDLPKGTIKLV